MDRLRITLLAACALLTTTIGSIDGDSILSTALPNPSGEVATNDLPAVSSLPPHAAGSNAAPEVVDAEIIAKILERLSIRHTALPERERVALAKTILRQARLHDLDPNLVISVIEIESAGYHLAVSHVGAMGLMQLLPSTAEELAHKLDIEWKGPDTLFDPTTNIRLGTAYLRQLKDRYGDVQIALAAYNWGPGRIDRRIRRGRTVPSLYREKVMRAFDRNATVTTSRS
jgi:soluble lytic murein transglycosylase-like protein